MYFKNSKFILENFASNWINLYKESSHAIFVFYEELYFGDTNEILKNIFYRLSKKDFENIEIINKRVNKNINKDINFDWYKNYIDAELKFIDEPGWTIIGYLRMYLSRLIYFFKK